MKKWLPILLMCFMLQGCSLLKIATAPLQAVKNSVPQSTEQSKAKTICSKDAVFNEAGMIISCGGKYYNYNQNYEQTDRKLTLREKIAQFITHGAGYLVWGFVIIVLLSSFGFGWVVQAFFNGVFGTGRVLKQVVQGIQDARKNNKEINQALSEAMDEKTKEEIAKLKQKENIK